MTATTVGTVQQREQRAPASSSRAAAEAPPRRRGAKTSVAVQSTARCSASSPPSSAIRVVFHGWSEKWRRSIDDDCTIDAKNRSAMTRSSGHDHTGGELRQDEAARASLSARDAPPLNRSRNRATPRRPQRGQRRRGDAAEDQVTRHRRRPPPTTSKEIQNAPAPATSSSDASERAA